MTKFFLYLFLQIKVVYDTDVTTVRTTMGGGCSVCGTVQDSIKLKCYRSKSLRVSKIPLINC